jgi:hypothetical protein
MTHKAEASLNKAQMDSDGDEEAEGWVFKLKVRLQAWAMVFPNDDDEVASQKIILFFFAFLAVPIFGYSMYLWIVLGTWLAPPQCLPTPSTSGLGTLRFAFGEGSSPLH